MTDLANIIHETRLNVSIVLNEMKEQQLITMQRGGFTINDLQTLSR